MNEEDDLLGIFDARVCFRAILKIVSVNAVVQSPKKWDFVLILNIHYA